MAGRGTLRWMRFQATCLGMATRCDFGCAAEPKIFMIRRSMCGFVECVQCLLAWRGIKKYIPLAAGPGYRFVGDVDVYPAMDTSLFLRTRCLNRLWGLGA